MSVDDQSPANTSNLDSPPPEKPKTRKGIWAGCGCLVLLVACCFAGAMWWGLTKIDQVRQEAMGVIESSSVAQEQLGSPVTIIGDKMATGPDGSLGFEFTVSGPNGTGIVTTATELDQQVGSLVISSYILDVGGQEFDLNAEDDFKMDIEGMDEF